jgi:signal transduction histidine kinase
MPSQILIVDDHEAVRRGIRSILSAHPEWKVCGEAADGLEAVEKALALLPDVVLMDISMPRMDGLKATRIIRKSLPKSKIVLVSQNDPEVVRRQVLEVDAAAYVAKRDLAQDLLPTLERLDAGYDPTGIDINIPESKRGEENYRALAESLEAAVHARTRELEIRNTEVLLQSEQLRDLSRRLLQAQDEERRRLARELHDSAGQILAALGMNLARIAQFARQNAPQLGEDIDDSERLVQELSQEIRTMSYLLHPPLLDDTGLGGALRWYVEGLTERGNLDILLKIPDHFGRLPRDMELVMFRVVQECLTNVHRHSGSKSAVISVTQEAGAIVLNVRDEGKGIPPEKLAEIQSRGAGVGIRGMRERVRPFAGQMNIASDGSGTTISFRFPLPAAIVQQNLSSSRQADGNMSSSIPLSRASL